MDTLNLNMNGKEFLFLHKDSIGPFIASSFLFMVLIILCIYFIYIKEQVSKYQFTILLTLFIYIFAYGMLTNSKTTIQGLFWIRIVYTAIVLNSITLVLSLYNSIKKSDNIIKSLLVFCSVTFLMLIWFTELIVVNKMIYTVHPKMIDGKFTIYFLIYHFLLAVIVMIKIFKKFIKDKSSRQITWPNLFAIVFWTMFNVYLAYAGKILNKTPNIWWSIIIILICLSLSFLLKIKVDNENLVKNIKEKNGLYQRMSRDFLTGVYEKNYFFQIIGNELLNLKKRKSSLFLIFIDIDKFKKINDTYGHNMGDDILRGFGKMLNETLKDKGISARYGGDEFLTLLFDSSEDFVIKTQEEIIEKYKALLEKYKIHNKSNFGISIGIISSKYWDDSITNIMIKADKAMYNSKSQGPNNISIYTNINEKENINLIPKITKPKSN